MDKGSLGHPVADWIYRTFLGMKNTDEFTEKRQDHIRRLLAHFGNNAIPLEALKTPSQRESISSKLFTGGKSRNFIVYSIGMAIHKGYLTIQGQELKLARPLDY